ncbi:MAG: phage tail tape measure protein, partial [Trebonia sp.]
KYKTALLGIGIGAGVAVDGAVKYQAETTKLVTSAGESAGGLRKVQQGMLALSGQTDQSTSELAKGMYLVESAGFHGANGLTVLKAAAQGAKDEGADVATVANGLTDALVDFHKPASDAANVTSQLIAGVSHGKTTFEEFAGSMSTILPLASSMHLKMADVVGVESEMTSHGISAAEASQQMANAMRELLKPNAAMVTEFTKLGITSDEVHQKLGTAGLSGTMQWLSQVAQKGAAGIGQNYNEALAKLTGSANGLQVALTTTGENTAGTTAAIKAVGSASADAKGNVDGFATVSQTASFKLGAAKQSAEAMGISLGMALLPAVTAMIGPITSFMQLIASNRAASYAFAIVVGGILTVALGGKLVGALKDAKSGVEGIAKGIGFVVGKFKDIGKAGQDAAKAAETASGAAATAQEADAAGVATANDEAAAESSTSWIVSAAKQVGAAAVWVAQSVAKVATVVASNVAGAATTLGAWVATGAGMVAQAVMWVAGTIAKVAVVVASNVAGAAVAAAAWIAANAAMLLGIGLVVAAVAIAVYEIVTHWKTIVHGVEAAWDAVYKFISKIVGDVIDFIKSHWPLVVGIFLGPIALVVAEVVKHWAQVSAFTEKLWHDVTGFISRMWSDVTGAVSRGVSAVLSWAKRLFDDFLSTEESGIANIVHWFEGLPGRILGAVGNLASLLLHAGESIITGLLNGIESAVGGLLSTVSNIGIDISGDFSSVLGIFSPSRVFFEHGKNTMQGYIDGVKSMTGQARNAVGGVAGSIASAGATQGVGAASAIAPAAGSTTVHVNPVVNVQGTTSNIYNDPQFSQYLQSQMQEAVLRYADLNPNNGLTPGWGR